eukprot:gene22940-60171_t
MRPTLNPRNFKLLAEVEECEKNPTGASGSLGLDSYDDITLSTWDGPPDVKVEGNPKMRTDCIR